MICRQCGLEISGNPPACPHCGAGQAVSLPIPRFPPGEPGQQPAYYQACPRCSAPVGAGISLCPHCQSDIRLPYQKPSRFGCGSCLGTLLLRLLSFVVASGVSMGVGWLAAVLGLGGLAAGLITGLISTLLSLAPPAIGWIVNGLRRNRSGAAILLIAAAMLGALIQPARAQAYQPRDILQEFTKRMGVDVRNWEPEEDPFPDYTVYFAPSANTPNSTNAAQVVYTQDVYGSNGGEVWAQNAVDGLDEGCAATQETFHDLTAYHTRCNFAEDIHIDVHIWGMGPWGAATFDFVAQDSYYPVKDLSEMLYSVLDEMVGAPGQSSEPPAGQEPAQPGLTNPTEEQRSDMAVGVLSELARQLGGENPDVMRGKITGSHENYILICDSQTIKSEDNYPCSALYPGRNFDDELQHLRGVNGSFYFLNYILERYDEPPRVKVLQAAIVYAPDRAILEKMLYSDTEFLFHGLPASTLAEGNIRWYREPWFFLLNISYNPAATYSFGQEPDIFYELTDRYGFYATAPPQGDVPENQPGGYDTIPLPLEGAGAVLPAAALPALAVTGLALLIDLIRLARGMPPGATRVPPTVAAAQQELIRRGYRYDPRTRTFQLAKVKSPVDGTLVSPAQAARERDLLKQGYVYDPTNGGFVTRDWQNQREQRREDFKDDLQQRRDAEVARQQADRQEAIRKQRAKVERLEEEARANQVKPLFAFDPSAEAGYSGALDSNDNDKRPGQGTGVKLKLLDAATYDAEDVIDDITVGGMDVGNLKGDMQAGKFQAGAGVGYDKKSGKYSAGAFGEYSTVQLTGEAVVGNQYGGLTGDLQADVGKIEGFAGVRDGSAGFSVGASVVSVEGGVGANVAGVNVGVRGGISLGFELGFKIGKDTEIKLGPFKVGLSFGAAKTGR